MQMEQLHTEGVCYVKVGGAYAAAGILMLQIIGICLPEVALLWERANER
jgi:hypothetical protein